MNACEAAYPPASVWNLRTARQDPLEFLQRLAGQGDVVPFRLAGHRALLLNHPDHVEDVLSVNHAKFVKPSGFRRGRALLGNGLLTAEGPHHQQRRQAVQPAFGPHRMAGYAEIVVQSAEETCRQLQDGQTVDMAALTRDLTLTIIGRVLFGKDLADRAADVHKAVTTASASMDPLLTLLAPGRRLRPARDSLRAIVNGLIDECCSPEADAAPLAPYLYRAENHQVTDQLRDDVLTLFVAGHETIANALTWTWNLLAQHPDAEGRLHDELRLLLGGRAASYGDLDVLTYTGWVLAESLRLFPPSWVLTRRAVDDHQVGGVPVPAGTLVVVSQYLLHRDARFFPDPLAFRPERWDPVRQYPRPKLAYFPFGAGPRSCIGQGFALVEGVLLLATIAQGWRCRSAGRVSYDVRATLRPRGPVPMTLERLTTRPPLPAVPAPRSPGRAVPF
jgi:cytochrome P450